MKNRDKGKLSQTPEDLAEDREILDPEGILDDTAPQESEEWPPDAQQEEEEEVSDLSPVYENDPDNPDRLRDRALPDEEEQEQVNNYVPYEDRSEEERRPSQEAENLKRPQRYERDQR